MLPHQTTKAYIKQKKNFYIICQLNTTMLWNEICLQIIVHPICARWPSEYLNNTPEPSTNTNWIWNKFLYWIDEFPRIKVRVFDFINTSIKIWRTVLPNQALSKFHRHILAHAYRHTCIYARTAHIQTDIWMARRNCYAYVLSRDDTENGHGTCIYIYIVYEDADNER